MVRMRKSLITLLPMLFSVWLTGCASVPAGSQQDNFSAYAEDVFRRQNQLISRLMMLSDSENPIEDEQFEQTEQAMHESCELLNEYAEREISGESISLRFKMQVQDSIQACDHSVQRLEALVAVLVKDH